MSKDLGHQGELLAAEHFMRLGYDLVARGFRTRFGEIDLIVADDRSLVFVEVKTRRAGSGHPWESLHEAKRRQVRRMGAAWLAAASDRPYYEEIRFDAVGVVIDAQGALVSLNHLESAF